MSFISPSFALGLGFGLLLALGLFLVGLVAAPPPFGSMSQTGLDVVLAHALARAGRPRSGSASNTPAGIGFRGSIGSIGVHIVPSASFVGRPSPFQLLEGVDRLGETGHRGVQRQALAQLAVERRAHAGEQRGLVALKFLVVSLAKTSFGSVTFWSIASSGAIAAAVVRERHVQIGSAST
jgi:hypothetical protein